jgi:hypothetical protein
MPDLDPHRLRWTRRGVELNRRNRAAITVAEPQHPKGISVGPDLTRHPGEDGRRIRIFAAANEILPLRHRT